MSLSPAPSQEAIWRHFERYIILKLFREICLDMDEESPKQPGRQIIKQWESIIRDQVDLEVERLKEWLRTDEGQKHAHIIPNIFTIGGEAIDVISDVAQELRDITDEF